MTEKPTEIFITYDPLRRTAAFIRREETANSIWERLCARAIAEQSSSMFTENTIELAWPKALSILRDFGNRHQQQSMNFRFIPEGPAVALIKQFSSEVRAVAEARSAHKETLSDDQINSRLLGAGFTNRTLKPFQTRDLGTLAALPHGANFSVPGAGKTTVTFALYLATKEPGRHLFAVTPKSAFPAWKSIVRECIASSASGENREEFVVLDGRPDDVERLLRSGRTRFLMSYDLMVRQSDIIANYFARQPVHLVLDEAHRMKAGVGSQRGAFLLGVASLPVRRDILTGTPMPQGPEDMAAQLDFLWPGQGLSSQIVAGNSPKSVLGDLYVRTTKRELGIPPAERHHIPVDMAPGQLALYSLVRSEALRQLVKSVGASGSGDVDYLSARRSVMRLLQLSTNPILALQSLTSEVTGVNSGVIDRVLGEGPSLKMRAVEDHVRKLAASGQKTVVWTIFTDTIHEMERMLADINPVTIYGAIPAGDENDPGTREGRLARFHQDPACHVLIANPAAAGEGISLHTVCHNAIYIDRSYVSTHYLQSIDRIHRLGLPPDTKTNIYIYQTKAPPGLGSIDYSVSRRLATKIRALQQLLDDPDLHEVAFDEENADDPISFDIRLEDLVDLIGELEGKAGSEFGDFDT